MTYNKNRNYKDEIDAAVRAGNYVLAGSLERERNAKIDGEGLGYGKTNDYTGYLDKDYGKSIQELIRTGASGAAVAAERDRRNQKSALSGYTQYQNDDIDRQAQQYIDLQTALNTPFSYEKGMDTVNAREAQLNELMDGLRNYEKFSYNPETDPLYAALSAQYAKNGQRAMQDTIAQMAARTGGLASSYAATAGNQAYGNYMSELGSKIPELSQLAYQMYNDEYNRKLNQAQMAQNMYESAVSRYNNDRNFAYGQYADNRNMAYNRLNDMVSGERYLSEWNYGVEQDKLNRADAEKQWDYSTKLEKAQTMAALGNFDGFRELGWTEDQIKQMEYAYAAQNTKKTGSGGAGVKTSSAYDDVVEELWGVTDVAEVDDFLNMKVAAKKITQAEADEIRGLILGSDGNGIKPDASDSSLISISTVVGDMLGAKIDMKNPDKVTAYLDEYLEKTKIPKKEKEELAERILQALGLL